MAHAIGGEARDVFPETYNRKVVLVYRDMRVELRDESMYFYLVIT